MTENSELREKMLAEAIRIGDWLISCAERGASGWSWKTMTMDKNRVVSWEAAESLYSGVAGISWYLMHLYKVTGRSEYLDAAVEGMRWTTDACRKTETNYYAFITGRLGVTYCLLELSRITGDNAWLQQALEIARPCMKFTSPEYEVDDMINGHAGAIIGVLHLYAASGEPWLLEAADGFVRNLLKRAHQGKKGFYWDRGYQTISGLCGFSHGAGGIGWVFLELGRYFHNPAFYTLADQAFLYESTHYDHQKGNWIDLRKGIYADDDEQEHRQALLNDDLDFFTIGGDMNAWCHGSAGNGLSRLRAMQLFQGEARERVEKEALACIEKTRLTDVDAPVPPLLYILCHGAGGNADLFITAGQILGDEKYFGLAERVAAHILASREQKGSYLSGFRDAAGNEDRSLFMGNAGIGLFLLRLLAPEKVSSILVPMLHAEFNGAIPASCPHLSLSLRQMTEKLLERSFRRTLNLFETWAPAILDRFFSASPLASAARNLNREFIDFVEAQLPELPEKEKNCINDIFIMEREKVKLDDAIPSLCRLYIRDKVLTERAQPLVSLSREAFLSLELITGPDVVVASTDWNWEPAKPELWLNNINLEPDVCPVLLKPLPTGVMEEQLSPLSYTILGGFDGGKTVAAVRQETIDAFEVLTPDQEEMITDKVIEQIKQALLVGILVEVKK